MRGDLFEDGGQRGAGDDAVLHDVVRGEASGGGEGGFAALPDEGAILRVDGEARLPCAVVLCERDDGGHLEVDLGLRAVELDEQESFADGIVGMDGGFGGLDGEAVHDLHGGGELAGGDDVGDGLGGGGDGVEGGEDDLHGLGLAHDAEGHLGGDAECAFGADEDAEQIVAGGVGGLAAEGDDLAGGKDDGHLEDVGGGEAVLEAVGSAGVLGDVAADGADGLRAGVGRVEEALRGDGGGDVGVDDAGLHGDLLVGEIDVEDAVHAGEADDDGAFGGERSAAEAGACAARDEGDVVLRADADDGLYLLGAARQDDGGGHDAEGGEAVALVGLELVGRGDEARRAGRRRLRARVQSVTQSAPEDGGSSIRNDSMQARSAPGYPEGEWQGKRACTGSTGASAELNPGAC